MRRFLFVCFVGLGLAFNSLAQGQDSFGQIDDAGIKIAVAGKTFIGHYDDGEPWRETYLLDGELEYIDTQDKSRGTWHVERSRLCTFYTGNALSGGCFVMIKRSNNCYDFYAVEVATDQPRATADEIQLGVAWTARGWRSDQADTCPNGLVS